MLHERGERAEFFLAVELVSGESKKKKRKAM